MSKLSAHLIRHANERPDQLAVITLRPGGVAVATTYRELHDRVARLSAGLKATLDQPMIVPILMSKSADCVATMLAVLASGSAFAVLNRKLKAPQLNAAITASRARLGVIDAESMSLLKANANEPFSRLPWLDVQSSSDQTALLAIADREGNSVGCCLFTSGSTGHPKGVLIAEQDLGRRAVAEVDLFALTPADVLLCVLPFSFDVGLNQLLSSIVAGCTLVLSESWLPVDLLRAVAKFGVTGISGVPAVWNDLINSPLRFDRSGEHRSLRYVTVSGGDLPVERLERLAQAVDGAAIFKTYGQSETFRSAALAPADFHKKTRSVGRAFGGASIYIVREDGTRAAPDEPGEIVHAGPGTMLGYLDGPTANLKPNPFYGDDDPNPLAVFTGDTGHLDHDGFLFVHGRRDAMLKVAGNRVYPKEIVDHLLNLSGVIEAEVLGKKNAQGETQLTAFVSPATLDAAAVRRQLSAKVPSYMVPKSMIALPALPKTSNGKIDHPALMQMYKSPAVPAEVSL